MNIFTEIPNSENKDIIISLSNDKTWPEYLSYFIELKADGKTFSIIVSTAPKTAPGKKCFLVFDGLLKGWVEIYKIRETEENDIRIELIPFITSAAYQFPIGHIEEYNYYFDNSNMQ